MGQDDGLRRDVVQAIVFLIVLKSCETQQLILLNYGLKVTYRAKVAPDPLELYTAANHKYGRPV